MVKVVVWILMLGIIGTLVKGGYDVYKLNRMDKEVVANYCNKSKYWEWLIENFTPSSTYGLKHSKKHSSEEASFLSNKISQSNQQYESEEVSSNNSEELQTVVKTCDCCGGDGIISTHICHHLGSGYERAVPTVQEEEFGKAPICFSCEQKMATLCGQNPPRPCKCCGGTGKVTE